MKFIMKLILLLTSIMLAAAAALPPTPVSASALSSDQSMPAMQGGCHIECGCSGGLSKNGCRCPRPDPKQCPKFRYVYIDGSVSPWTDADVKVAAM
ncbi:hypothetical protein EJ06DRAFT_582712 [Trichodelitschia bisporula]|uniref:Secreted protein n=1 Tax=Trichodelitschia bisporula TaxID=703511 RepID=A0A6G1HTX3_9PEZI|nr:hypothetical protein EJ06DRAFT_582712 [Trichodelitschia bisporula]